MTQDDLRIISTMMKSDRTYGHFYKRIHKEFDRNSIEENQQVDTLYVYDEEDPIGFLILSPSETKLKIWAQTFKDEGWVNDDFSIEPKTSRELMYMYVKPAYRGLGNGMRLMKNMNNISQARGVTHIYAYVGDKTDRALHFYTKRGAKVIEDFSDDEIYSAFIYLKL